MSSMESKKKLEQHISGQQNLASTDFAAMTPEDRQQRHQRDLRKRQDPKAHKIDPARYLETSESNWNLKQFLRRETPPSVLTTVLSALREAGIITQQQETDAPKGKHPNSRATYLLERHIDLEKIEAARKLLHDHAKLEQSPENADCLSKWEKLITFKIYAKSLNEASHEDLYSRAIIYLDSDTGSERIETNIYYPGDGRKRGEHTFSTDSNLRKELRISYADAEVATKDDIQKILAQKPNKRYTSLSIDFLGSFGPCNGCKHRIKELASELENSELYDKVTVRSYYWASPRIAPTEDGEMHFGRARDAVRINIFGDSHDRTHNFYMEECSASSSNFSEQLKRAQSIDVTGGLSTESTNTEIKGKPPEQFTKVTGTNKSVEEVANEFIKEAGKLTGKTYNEIVAGGGVDPKKADTLIRLIIESLPEKLERDRVSKKSRTY